MVSNFASNYINLELNRGELIGLTNQLLIKDLAELYGFASTQNQIYAFNGNLPEAVKAIEGSASKSLTKEHSTAFAVKKNGELFFWASKQPKPESFKDATAMKSIADNPKKEGKINFRIGGAGYFGVFKYNDKWDAYIIRAEESREFQKDTDAIFYRVSGIILILTAILIGLGAILVTRILRFVGKITQSLMKMQTDQKMELIDLSGAPSDQISYLGASFNSLSSTIDNLMSIFRRFVTQDIAQRAYRDREIRLEGTTRNLTILFSDIKGFTFMTETLGNDIIDVLNLHYQRAIGRIHDEQGIVGSIIGDALLAVFGTMGDSSRKSVNALDAAYNVQEVASDLRKEMHALREAIVKKRGALTEAEESVYKAALLEVGVGIDGGDVFYGNIGSYERMTNTVIGDNVNSSSRLEGLTRIYRVPVICSEFIKDEVEPLTSGFHFLELDTVQVKGKTLTKRIFWPVRKSEVDSDLEAEFNLFSDGLKLYYAGSWAEALTAWERVTLPLAEVFRERIAGRETPADWNGVWAMTTK
ncbi:MAG: adenylate/guanylate cyclase domain-containing protein [Rectinemataceae bacterium]